MSNLCVCEIWEPIITRRGVFDFTSTSAPATDSCIRPRSSGTVRVHDARIYASGRTTTVTGAGGAPRVDPRGLEDDGAGAGASSCVVPPSFRRM